MILRARSRIGSKIISRIIILGILASFIALFTSYLTLLPPLKDRAIGNARNVNKQIAQQTDYLLSYIKDYAESIPSDESFKTSFVNYVNNPGSDQYYQLVCLNLNRLSSQRSYIRNILIETDNHSVFNSIAQVDPSDLNLLQSEWYRTLRRTDYGSGFSTVYPLKQSSQDTYGAAYSKNFYLYDQRVTVTICFRVNEMFAITKSLAAKTLNEYLWLDSSLKQFYPSDITDWSKAVTDELIPDNLYKTDVIKAFGGYNFINASEESGWTIVSLVSEKSLFDTFRGYFFMIVILFASLILMTVILITPVISSITEPVGRLAAVMSRVAEGNLDVVSDVSTDDEIGELSRIFNRMIEDLRGYISKLLKKEELEQRMKYSLLISQIDPHFIYNTMNTINFLARKGRNEDIIGINTALIRILQDRLRVNNIEVFDTIEQEINIVKEYILIQNYRYENDVDILWDVDESLLGIQIPKNIIQPLVENAFFHGLTNEEDGEIKGYIKISIKSLEDRIVVEVSDNGRGIDPDKLEQLKKIPSHTGSQERGRHIGLLNVRDRLSYLYSNLDCMQIESTPFKGTSVKLILIPNRENHVKYDL